MVSTQTVIATGSQTLPETLVPVVEEAKTAQASIIEPEKKEIEIKKVLVPTDSPINPVTETKTEIASKNEFSKQDQIANNKSIFGKPYINYL